MARRSFFLAAALTGCCAPALGAESAALAPSKPWNLRYDEQACRLVRVFGTGDEAVTFTLSRYGPSSGFELILAGKDLNPRGARLRYRFLPGADFEVEEKPFYGSRPDGSTAWQFGGSLVPDVEARTLEKLAGRAKSAAFRQAEVARSKAITGFEMHSGMKRSFVLQTGALDEAFAALDTCIDDLVGSWGYDPVQVQSLTRGPEPKTNPGSWMNPADYPQGLSRQGVGGIVRFRLDVDDQGKPARCVVQAAFTDPAFEEAACKILMEKARFDPALDAQGNPVAAYWRSSVKWLPGN
ncbi:TonB family protein [Tsuneonella sp. SYSU-LHT278]|uniref:TonB family protein n=1 Tax=Tsuneonella sediminis TaxID=3416089 RepID=UPI003F78C446